MWAEASSRRQGVTEQPQQWKDTFLKSWVPGKKWINLFLSSGEVARATMDSLLLWVLERFSVAWKVASNTTPCKNLNYLQAKKWAGQWLSNSSPFHRSVVFIVLGCFLFLIKLRCTACTLFINMLGKDTSLANITNLMTTEILHWTNFLHREVRRAGPEISTRKGESVFFTSFQKTKSNVARYNN